MKSSNELALTAVGSPVAHKLADVAKEARYYADAVSELEGARHHFVAAEERLHKAETAYTNAAISLNKVIESHENG